MFYFVRLPVVRYCRQIDEITAIRLASVSATFSYFKCDVDNQPLIQATPIFDISDSFSWQSVDLFLGLFSNMGRPLSLQMDNLVEFVRICGYFMVTEPFVYSQLCVLFPIEYFESFRENVFCNVLFALRVSGYLCLARDLMAFACNCFEDIFCFNDLVSAQSETQFFHMVNQRFFEIENGGLA